MEIELNMEIERKYLVEQLPQHYQLYKFHSIQQGYLCTSPVVRIRKEDQDYYLTYKGSGLLAREEYNLPLTKEAYEHLVQKIDGILLSKRRYRIPLSDAYSSSLPKPKHTDGLMIELDIFEGIYQGLVLAEVEFPSVEEAQHFAPPSWFGRDVTLSGEYQNSKLSAGK